MFHENELINGQYEVRQRLTGGMGHVYIAFDQVTEKLYAIKTLKDEYLDQKKAMDRFEREACNWINLGVQEYIVRAISFHRGELPLLILEYVDGPPLDQLLRAEPGGLSLAQTVVFGRQIATGLHSAHSFAASGRDRRIIHRDLKPGNIMVTRRCTAMLTDFGLARAQDDVTLTTGAFLGTLPYAPPEQLKETRSVTHRADLYALGAVLYEMVTGVRAFRSETAAELWDQIRYSNPDPVTDFRPDAPSDLITLIDQCLQKDPTDRPASASEVNDTLRQIQNDMPIQDGRAQCSECGYFPNREHLRCPVCGTTMEKQKSIAPQTSRRVCCDREIPKGFAFCIYCGKSLDSPNSELQPSKSTSCRNCEREIPPGFRFCTFCGANQVGG